jgi:hypothetical protein
MKRWHITPLLFLFCGFVHAQVNLKAGYSLTVAEAAAHNAVIKAHEARLSEGLDENYKPLEILHGLDLGLEYRWETIALEAGWRIKRNRQEGSGVHTGTLFRNKLRYSMASFYTGIVQYLGPVRISASLDFTYIRNRLEFEQPASLTVFTDNAWGSQFSIGYVLKGSGPASLVIAPQVQINWTDFNLGPLQSTLTEQPSGPVYEDYINYGITVLFLNGPR